MLVFEYVFVFEFVFVCETQYSYVYITYTGQITAGLACSRPDGARVATG